MAIYGGSHDQPSTNFEDPVAIPSWVMSCDISHRIPLTMRLQPVRIRRITWLTRRGKFFRLFEIPDPRFAYSLHSMYGATVNTKGVMRQSSAWPCVKDQLFSGVSSCGDVAMMETSLLWISLNEEFWVAESRIALLCRDVLDFWRFHVLCTDILRCSAPCVCVCVVGETGAQWNTGYSGIFAISLSNMQLV